MKHDVPCVLLALLLVILSACYSGGEKGQPEKESTPNEIAEKNITRDLRRLTKGLLAYQIPVNMKVGESYRGVVSITRSTADSILFDGLEEGQDDFEKEAIQISSIAKVRLVDPATPKNFAITPINTPEQYVDTASNTVWKWDIKPLKGGKNQLYLIATAKILSPVEGYKDITVFDKNIEVESSLLVSLSMFFTQYWQWIISVLVIPLLGWLINRLASRKKKARKP